jgi:hypothetical protein
MISAKRIVTLFHQTGGGGEFTKLAEEFTEAQLAPLRVYLDEERPLIASVKSPDDWFVLTPFRLISKNRGGLRKIPFENVEWIDSVPADFKLQGGDLGIKLRNGRSLRISIESGRPYTALMNVLMYVARVTGPPSGRTLTGKPTTNDRRPTTHS